MPGAVVAAASCHTRYVLQPLVAPICEAYASHSGTKEEGSEMARTDAGARGPERKALPRASRRRQASRGISPHPAANDLFLPRLQPGAADQEADAGAVSDPIHRFLPRDHLGADR